MADDVVAELNELFAGAAPGGIPKDVLAELQSILRVHSIAPQELFYKWESYCLKMGAEETKLNLDTVRMFKRDVQDILERESRGKAGRHAETRKATTATPRANATSDVFGMFDGLTPNASHNRTPNNANGSAKRKSDFGSPSISKVGRGGNNESPMGTKAARKLANGGPVGDGPQPVPFSERPNPGQTVETLNSQLSAPDTPMAPYSEARIKPTANTDLKKFGYKPMAMRQSEASEILDDRIDEFMALFQKQYETEDLPFGSASIQSTSEVVAVGRIASDSLEGKLNPASLVLETSRRTGAGLRVPLKIESLPSVNFIPGQIVALRGINASGNYFSVKEILPTPLLPPAASSVAALDNINNRLEESGSSPLNVLIASGPYTADDNLEFEPLHEICQKAADSLADSLILMGPFLDIEHPLLASGDFDLPELNGLDPDMATLTTVFRHCISTPLQRLAAAVPSITIVLLPSVRDAVSKHVSWPQEQLPKKELGLPKQVRMVSNPVTLSLNETVIGMGSHDVLYELRKEEVLHGRPAEGNLLTRLPNYLIEQRHFLPIFPPSSRDSFPKPPIEDNLATGAMLDVSYLKLGEWWNVRPDVLITPSMLPPFVKVVNSVLVINPGTLSKRRAAGTYAQMAIHRRDIDEEERDQKQLSHKLYERARVDIIRI
ncbi:DNA polymerase alpha/primase associated subunit [Aspergillus steynii IBT 23096]|uniref:DNA polymerase alpha subunit B n=1 Tax=Aspergillus steynii IBT 23096 TaxID=1392250 RepID=A0A2I2FUR2_9EURO|nr:DNA polymerase alpha/primase associated subunit [Aspergillus steynii IBT 23096]PLB44337.1 DNA polymerase alpha/primase associated subunit [Aspergillus steynii IBT 23096]